MRMLRRAAIAAALVLPVLPAAHGHHRVDAAVDAALGR